MGRFTVFDYAEAVLSKAEKPLQYQEIWERGAGTELEVKLAAKGKTPWQSLGARLFVDVRDNEDSKFIKVGSRPARFFLKSRKKELPDDIVQRLEAEETKAPKERSKYEERDLHPLLAYVAFYNVEFNRGRSIRTKTIYHEKSNKKGLNEWIHPDMVGVYIPIGDWPQKLMDFNEIVASNNVTIYSFELKKSIDRSNYRQYFFQAVSNSSWAHEGYLVAPEIKPDDDLRSELERLSSSFGIGIIKLDLDNLDESKVLFPARARKELEWELMNKLCEQNPDFESFIEDVTKDFKVKRYTPNSYDKVLEDPTGYIKKMTKG